VFKIENDVQDSNDEKRAEKAILDGMNTIEHFGKYCFPRFRKGAWDILEHPKSSLCAKVNLKFNYFY
jgi:hypothetical protein